ncbi:N-acetylglucosamine-6-phosphate deacetylase [Litorivicinus lipolyticus]|uniref:N-acetylglucosamine-6-phosphate deacetylase n=1 Tax=Litorivicinus lipolyticus TaxID=418701 RepID=UPI003B5C88F8
MTVLEGWVWQADAMVPARITYGTHIEAIEVLSDAPADRVILPASIDTHLHGGGGFDSMQGERAIRAIAKTHARHGLGAFLATTVTAPFDDIETVIDAVARIRKDPEPGAAEVLGVHLEGPFINPGKLGAQPDHAVPIDWSRLEKWLNTGLIKVITVAPELDPDSDLIALCIASGARIQLGHSLCQWHQAKSWLERGCGVTHLFNAMSGNHHRDTGLAGAAMAFADFAEVIVDGEHVSEPAFKSAHRAIPNLFAVSDATAAAGMPDGLYQLGGLEVEKRGQQVLLPDGTLAGSCLTANRARNVLRQWGVDWHQIGVLTAARPARWLGLPGWGAIQPGAATRLWVQHGATSFSINGGHRIDHQPI